MKIKLSPAQLEVLVKMEKGARLYYLPGLYGRWFFSADQGYTYSIHLNPQTVWKLEDLGLIEGCYSEHPILTDKGRTYLDEISQTIHHSSRT